MLTGRPLQEIFDLASGNLQHLDSINITAALQRLAKLLDTQPPTAKEAALESPVLQTLAGGCCLELAGLSRSGSWCHHSCARYARLVCVQSPSTPTFIKEPYPTHLCWGLLPSFPLQRCSWTSAMPGT